MRANRRSSGSSSRTDKAQTASQHIHLALHTSTGAAENAELAGLYAAGTISATTRQRLQLLLTWNWPVSATKQTDRWVISRVLVVLLFLAGVRVRASICSGVPGSLVGDVRDLGARRLGGTQ